jgi:hypothetical protein
MTLLETRMIFSRLVPRLLDQATLLGFRYTINEVVRRVDTLPGPAVSCHVVGLAIDLNLYQGMTYLTDSESHRPLGEWWEAQYPLARWGGRFSKPDGNHYSFEWKGVK